MSAWLNLEVAARLAEVASLIRRRKPYYTANSACSSFSPDRLDGTRVRLR